MVNSMTRLKTFNVILCPLSTMEGLLVKTAHRPDQSDDWPNLESSCTWTFTD
jgi:hypothetical protein